MGRFIFSSVYVTSLHRKANNVWAGSFLLDLLQALADLLENIRERIFLFLDSPLPSSPNDGASLTRAKNPVCQ